MSDELPEQRETGGRYLSCEWCGEPVNQVGARTPRRYCKRSHRQRAYEARRLQRAAGLVPAEPPAPPAEVEAPALLELADFPEPSGVQGEECPYCRDVVVGLVVHLRQCQERPGAAGEDGRDWFEPRRRRSRRRTAPTSEAPRLPLPEE